ncbi:tRNA lysidine(34) synthetase TilS [Spiroplasma monobiae]|uniref:tRNA lysidine(34) synthetase TilS n=1 Tax=Spiroplasma monobiae (strain ATCC 33825 / MQ-1) TaxID=2136 RepID=UPI0013154062|nr:tRNA lysidine(34) synthetase TilS [Spiroplasma monobiae]
MDKERKYIIGLSGGADSVFLFHKLIEEGYKNFVACHVNYNFRPDSNKDLDLVRRLCEQYKIKLIVKNLKQDYSNLAQNFESWAREVRYDFFCENLLIEKAEGILIAHNLNDNIETYIMQTKNNKTVKFYGINAIGEYKGNKILRPIIDLKKSFIVNSLNERSIPYIIDITNFDEKYERNKIRKKLKEEDFHKYLSLIEESNKKIDSYNLKIQKIDFSKDLNIDFLNEDNIWNEKLIFKFLEFNGMGNEIYKSKKSLIKEIVKQTRSNKSLVEIIKGNFLIMKDYKKLRVLKNSDFKTYEYLNNKEDMFQKILNENKIIETEGLIITNDWKKYQSLLEYDNKKLSKVYKDNKTSYFERYKNILIFNKTKKIVLNKITI